MQSDFITKSYKSVIRVFRKPDVKAAIRKPVVVFWKQKVQEILATAENQQKRVLDASPWVEHSADTVLFVGH